MEKEISEDSYCTTDENGEGESNKIKQKTNHIKKKKKKNNKIILLLNLT
jgi:hypothetical protein